jgi:hypothetical protein
MVDKMKNGLIVDLNGTKSWYLYGQRHRVDGPAVEYADGAKFWFLHNQLHRVDGPAEEYADGSKYWYQHNQLHRVDGPAIEWSNGTKRWYYRGTSIDCQNQTEFERHLGLKPF